MMAAPVDADLLVYERFHHAAQLASGFDSGNLGLNEFLLSDEVHVYERDQLAKTWLVRYRPTWEVVAYYATAGHSVHVTHAKRSPRVRPRYQVQYLSALLIGRLAVQVPWQRRGIGQAIIAKLAVDAVDNEFCAFRLLVLAAEPASIAFYKRLGFDYLDGRKYKNQDKPMMFLDLLALAEALELRTEHGRSVQVGGRESLDLH